MSETTTVGQNAFRTDAVSKVTGAALYPGDLTLPHMAHMKILFARRPHAIVKSIDTSKAKQAPGVIAIFTAKDVPNNEYGLIIPDQPVLVGPGSTPSGPPEQSAGHGKIAGIQRRACDFGDRIDAESILTDGGGFRHGSLGRRVSDE